jgi:hypothetical protein
MPGRNSPSGLKSTAWLSTSSFAEKQKARHAALFSSHFVVNYGLGGSPRIARFARRASLNALDSLRVTMPSRFVSIRSKFLQTFGARPAQASTRVNAPSRFLSAREKLLGAAVAAFENDIAAKAATAAIKLRFIVPSPFLFDFEICRYCFAAGSFDR